MTQYSWPWNTDGGVGDGAAPLNETLSRMFLAIWFGVQNPAVEGVSKGVGGELAVSGAASPLSVASGSAICYGLYINDAAQATPAIAAPAVGTTGGRVVLQTNWPGTGGGSLESRTRIAVKKSTDGNTAIPPLTQTFGVTWEISLATFQITTAGVITLTDDRTFRKSTSVVAANGLDANTVGNTILRDSAALSVIGKPNAGVGDPTDIVSSSDDTFLSRIAGALGWARLTLAMIPDALITGAKLVAGTVGLTQLANDSVDDTKAGNRVAQFIRRKGGDATNWWVPGTTVYTPGAVRIQAGVQDIPNAGPETTITFPVAFSAPPLVFTQSPNAIPARVEDILATSFNVQQSSGGTMAISWVAFGPE